jgi:hypothetical protein
MELWLPQVPNSEIAGGVLIAIGAAGLPAQPPCEFCRTPMLSSVDCPSCGKPVGLETGAVLGCIKDGCIARMWNWICCPTCDYVFTLRAGAAAGTPVEAQPSAGTAAPVAAVDIAKLFAEIDKFTSQILSIPAAANDPRVKQKLELVAATKEQFKTAHAEDFAHRTAIFGQFAAVEQKNNQQKDAQSKKMEDLKNAPPLDGDALSEEMLKNLGFK